ncbi:hypothetical protein EJ04DRAFT_512622 [Polyplosphaeria fusca]|uniref:Uncharacterized protein n=1 Tax=Polyplosphaeria fusca TaxID=682080 RepID=A0A9P4UZH6_9PLEO|nr:hypothetical protein EJ04DRAFT_512622 [Polyplosphaeria fusca]
MDISHPPNNQNDINVSEPPIDRNLHSVFADVRSVHPYLNIHGYPEKTHKTLRKALPSQEQIK